MRKLHYKPIDWNDMPMSARKFWLRTSRTSSPHPLRGWEWFYTFAERTKMYAVQIREMRWFVADIDEGQR